MVTRWKAGHPRYLAEAGTVHGAELLAELSALTWTGSASPTAAGVGTETDDIGTGPVLTDSGGCSRRGLPQRPRCDQAGLRASMRNRVVCASKGPWVWMWSCSAASCGR
ncbi:conserved hypothetical protein [Parafrankia sp. EUN1f]|nr:conserved hypothetical protein [Parafrankia sp. EUN1f]